MWWRRSYLIPNGGLLGAQPWEITQVKRDYKFGSYQCISRWYRKLCDWIRSLRKWVKSQERMKIWNIMTVRGWRKVRNQQRRLKRPERSSNRRNTGNQLCQCPLVSQGLEPWALGTGLGNVEDVGSLDGNCSVDGGAKIWSEWLGGKNRLSTILSRSFAERESREWIIARESVRSMVCFSCFLKVDIITTCLYSSENKLFLKSWSTVWSNSQQRLFCLSKHTCLFIYSKPSIILLQPGCQGKSCSILCHEPELWLILCLPMTPNLFSHLCL